MYMALGDSSGGARSKGEKAGGVKKKKKGIEIDYMMTRGIISRVLFHGPEVLCKCSRKFEIPGSCNLGGMVVCEGKKNALS